MFRSFTQSFIACFLLVGSVQADSGVQIRGLSYLPFSQNLLRPASLDASSVCKQPVGYWESKVFQYAKTGSQDESRALGLWAAYGAGTRGNEFIRMTEITQNFRKIREVIQNATELAQCRQKQYVDSVSDRIAQLPASVRVFEIYFHPVDSIDYGTDFVGQDETAGRGIVVFDTSSKLGFVVNGIEQF